MDRENNYRTYLYEPLVTQEEIDKVIHWVLGFLVIFLITAGDLQMLPRVLEAANRFERGP